MATIFDGRAFAAQKEESLKIRVLGLKTRLVYPKLASILVGTDQASTLYVNLKKKAAERIGAEVDIYKITKNSKLEDLIFLINTLNKDETVQGIMVQLPLPQPFVNCKLKIVNSIAPAKDVDGLKDDSPFLHPTSKAVIEIIDFAVSLPQFTVHSSPLTVCVVGATGMVGKPLARELREQKYEVLECNSKTSDLKGTTLQGDILVSVTGTPNIIKSDMVKPGAIVIDVGSPKGDVVFDEVSKVASFVSPVPGGVGPITITCLLENLISAC